MMALSARAMGFNIGESGYRARVMGSMALRGSSAKVIGVPPASWPATVLGGREVFRRSWMRRLLREAARERRGNVCCLTTLTW